MRILHDSILEPLTEWKSKQWCHVKLVEEAPFPASNGNSHSSSSFSSILFDLILRSSTKFLREHDDLLLLECLKKISSYLSRCISITLPDHPTCILPFKHGLEAPGVKEYLKTNRRLGPKGFNSQPLKGGDDCFFMFVYHIAKMEQICVYIYILIISN